MNNKGFAISTILYSLLLMASIVLFLLIGVQSFERKSTNNFVNDIKNELNDYVLDKNNETINQEELNIYYLDGTPVLKGEKIRLISKLDTDIPRFALSDNGMYIIMFSYDKNNINQQFVIRDSTTNPNYYKINKVNSGLIGIYLDNSTSTYNVINRANDTFCINVWTFEESDEVGYYYIKSITSKYLTVDDNNLSNGVSVSGQILIEGSANQKFRFEKVLENE